MKLLTGKLTAHKAILEELNSEIASNELKIVDKENELQKLEAERETADVVQTKHVVQFI